MNKNTAIITFHRALNYGAALQAYALQESIKKLGGEPTVINYACPKIESIYRPYDGSHCGSMTAKIKKYLKSPQLVKKRRAFDSFENEYLNLTELLTDRDDFSLLNDRFGNFITGSDQVFNPDASGGDMRYFLDFVSDDNKISAYGASFGYDHLPPGYEKVGELLKRFDNITVREKTGTGIAESLSGKTANSVLDPTLLLQESEWKNIISLPAGTPEQFILVYMMEGCSYTIDRARELAKHHDCRLVLVNPTLQQQYKCRDFKQYTSISPQEFAGLFNYAEQVVTNSFHGLAFSLIFHKTFYCETSNAAKSSRITDLLDVLGLRGHLLPNGNGTDIDWAAVDVKLDELRAKSVDLLSDMI